MKIEEFRNYLLENNTKKVLEYLKSYPINQAYDNLGCVS